MSKAEIGCVLCGGATVMVEELSGQFLKRSLEEYYHSLYPLASDLKTYAMLKCIECDLVFCHPMIPGSFGFYRWLGEQPAYYPASRWEWQPVFDILQKKSTAVDSVAVLEVGCGKGDFLKLIRQLSNIEAIGLDTSATAIAAACERGLQAFCRTLEEYKRIDAEKQFDFVMAFHCLEHVGDPLQFVLDMRSLLKPGGKLLISTPYSPMSFEYQWFDPLNHPPHHMTRWNKRSYEKLAQLAGLKLELSTSPAKPVIERWKEAMGFLEGGVNNKLSSKGLMNSALRKPMTAAGDLWYQLGREKVNGVAAGNAVLAILSME